MHRAYLIASTVQWFANLGLGAVALVLWGEDPPGRPGSGGDDPGRDEPGIGGRAALIRKTSTTATGRVVLRRGVAAPAANRA
jgi:hypothetical protein